MLVRRAMRAPEVEMVDRKANAVFALILRRLSWLLLNMVPGARGFAPAPVAPLKRSTHIRQQPCRLVQGFRARRSHEVVALEADSEEAAS